LIDRYDALALLGLGLLGAGLGVRSPELAAIVLGSVLLVLAVAGALARGRAG